MSSTSNHVSRVRQTAAQLIDGVDKLQALKREWDALGYSAAIIESGIIGDNAGVTGADIAAVYVTLDALNTLLAQGHATNLYRAKL